MPFAGATAGTVSYNGYSFPGNVRTSVTGIPKYDRSGRTVVAVVYRMDVTWVIQNASGVDTDVENIRRRLQSAGQRLTYSLHGFGVTVDINGGTQTDVNWGPKCISLTLTPIGSNLAWEGRWTVEWSMPECTSARFNGVSEFNYTASQVVDENGYSTLTIEGELAIAMSRPAGGGRNVPDTADNYVEQINLPTPVGFRRLRKSRTISDDRRTVRFEVVFEELRGHGLPYFTTRATGRHILRSQAAEGAAFTSTISVEYTVYRKAQKSKAWQNFFQLLKDRVEPLFNKPGDTDSDPKSTVLYEISFEEGLYEAGDELRFEVSYLIAVDLTKVVAASGMWRPVPNTNWQQWAKSIDGADDFRGMAGIRFQPDVIVDLCGAPVSTGGISSKQKQESKSDQKTEELRKFGYLVWKNEIQVEPYTGRAVIKTLPVDNNSLQNNDLSSLSGIRTVGPFFNTAPPSSSSGGGSSTLSTGPPATPPDVPNSLFGGQRGSLQNVPAGQFTSIRVGMPASLSGNPLPTRTGDLIQQRVAPTYRIRMIGYAIAAGFRIPCPSLSSYAGLKVTPDDRRPLFVEKTLGQVAGVPLFMSYWDLPYTVLT